jgi:hypothetical protein
MKFKKSLLTLGVILILLIFFKAIFYIKFPYQNKAIWSLKKVFNYYAFNISSDINFAGEPVPINDFRFRAILDEELKKITYSKTKTLLLHKNSFRWFKTIEPILKKEGVPDDFKYIALHESQFSNSISKRGAAGFWQFMPQSALEQNLIINNEIDERLHVTKSTIAACKLFKKMYNKTNSWILTAAAFNLGLKGLQKQMKIQNTNDYFNLSLNKETARYVFKLLALKEIITKPAYYGYHLSSDQFYPFIPTQKIKLEPNEKINLKTFAQHKNINYRLLKALNPWILKDELTTSDTIPLYIEIPSKEISEKLILKLAEQDSLTARRLSKNLEE